MTPRRPYHHGDLRPALLRAAVATIGEVGAASMSMREVARRAGVSHTAATYHFGDRGGLLTAVAAEGYRLLGEALAAARRERSSFLEVGVAYVHFAVTHRAHYDVMFQPALYDRRDPAVQEAKQETAVLLYGTADADEAQVAAGVAAWSLVHGLATLWLNGNLPPRLGDDVEAVTRLVAPHLRVPATRASRPSG
jgi:AcrR family transcriptional regulator